MRNYLLLLLLLFAYSQNGYGQSGVYENMKEAYDQFSKEGKNDSSLIVAKKMNAWALQFKTDSSLRYAVSLGYVGNSFNSLSLGDSALYFWNKSLEALRMQQKSESLDAANCLIILGNYYKDMADYKTAEPYYKKALEIRKKTSGVANPDYASSLYDLGILCRLLGDYKAAEPYYKQALEIRKKSLGERHADYAFSLNSLGILYFEMGYFKVAEPYLKQALEIRKETLGEKHPDFASSLNNLGVLYKTLGDYKAAENYYKQALEIKKKALSGGNPDLASSLNNLGVLYKTMGNYLAAENYYEQALEIRKKAFGVDHPIYSRSLNNLGLLYLDLGNYKAAETLLKEVTEIRKKVYGDWHPDFASSLNNLGDLYKAMCNYKAAEPYYKQATEIRKKVFGDWHPDYASSLNSLGILYSDMGDYNVAEPYYRQALEIKKKSFGVEHPIYASTEVSYAYFLSQINKEREAYQILDQNFLKIAKQVADNFEWLNENQRESYWKKEDLFYEDLSFFANEVAQKVPEVVGLNYNGALFTKSKLLEAKITSENFYFEFDELRVELGYRRQLLVKLESEGSIEKEKFDKLNFEVDSLDKRLTLSWPEYAQEKKSLMITWDKVQQNLEEGEAAIEFVRFKNKSDSLIHYNALVLKKGDSQPRLFQLCAERDLQAISPEKGYSSYYSLVWQPIESALEGIKTIYFAPIGELYNVPFHAIYAPKRKGDENIGIYTKTEQDANYLMDRYTLHQLTSTRYLAMGLKQKAKEPVGTSLAMVGAVNYDYLPGRITTPSKKKKGEAQNRSSNNAYNKLEYLKGTKAELDLINQQARTVSWQTTVLEGDDATEEKITKLKGKESSAILHLATHGFAFPAYDFRDTTTSQKSLKYSYRYSSNPMVRSGLILAGGNWAWTGSDTLNRLGMQNGILTALEVSLLNLKKTKLVVLSACETGLGKNEGNEGTFGLKRGFKLAGVEQLIVSLWSIPDQETQELMALFYSDLTVTRSPTLSFQKAQQAMREKYPTTPFFWAGFVLVR